MSLKEVAERAGVSSASVSRVLNKNNVVRNTTRLRVMKAVEELINKHVFMALRSYVSDSAIYVSSDGTLRELSEEGQGSVECDLERTESSVLKRRMRRTGKQIREMCRDPKDGFNIRNTIFGTIGAMIPFWPARVLIPFRWTTFSGVSASH